MKVSFSATAACAGTAAPAPVASACPGLSRIVQARDGGLCRVRLAGGVLTHRQARAVALAAERCGNGIIEASNRANLQLRGIHDTSLPDLLDILLGAGLGPETPGADEVRNVLCSPSAGIDAEQLYDTRPLTSEILQVMQRRFAGSGTGPSTGPRISPAETGTSTPAAPAPTLSPKFSIQLDGGEALFMAGHHHDIWFAATRTSGTFAFGLAAAIPVESGQTRGALGLVQAGDIPALLGALVDAFLALRAPGETRMRQLLSRIPPSAVLEHAGRSAAAAIQATDATDAAHAAMLQRWCRNTSEPMRRFGAYPQRAWSVTPGPGLTYENPLAANQPYHVGAQAPLGRLTPEVLRGLADLAEQHGNGNIHITPWQGVLLPDVAAHATAAVCRELTGLGLILDPHLPLGAMLACAGSAGCAKAHTDTKGVAMQLARQLPHAREIHISGCERGCAAAHQARFTVLAEANERFSVYSSHPQVAKGRVTAPATVEKAPAGEVDAVDAIDAVNISNGDPHSRFGWCLAENLSQAQAFSLLQRFSSIDSLVHTHV